MSSDALCTVFLCNKVLPLFSNSRLHFCILKISAIGCYLRINTANIIIEPTSFKEDFRGNVLKLIEHGKQ